MRMQWDTIAGIFFFSFEQIVLSSSLTGYMLNFILRKEKKGNLISWIFARTRFSAVEYNTIRYNVASAPEKAEKGCKELRLR